jgi:hypothetical protein
LRDSEQVSLIFGHPVVGITDLPKQGAWQHPMRGGPPAISAGAPVYESVARERFASIFLDASWMLCRHRGNSAWQPVCLSKIAKTSIVKALS